MSEAGAVEPAAPAGWHADPAGRHALRYWDGVGWTVWVHDHRGSVVESPLSAAGPVLAPAARPPGQLAEEAGRFDMPEALRPPPDPDEVFSAARGGCLQGRPALGLAAGAFLAGLVLGGVLAAVAAAVTGNVEGTATLAAGLVGLWIPMVGAAFLASGSFGSGSLGDDLGARFAKVDLGWGVLVAVAGLMAAVATRVVLSPFPRLLGSNVGPILEQKGTVAGVVVIVASTLVGAPIVEELFFRGLLQRALLRFGGVAVMVQAVIFGLIHFNPAEGLGNVGVVAGVGAFGLTQGLAARHFGRIGPTVVAHALFNAVAVVPLLLH